MLSEKVSVNSADRLARPGHRGLREAIFRIALLFVCFECCVACATRTGTAAKAPAPPDFGPNVLVFDSSMPDIQPRIDAIFEKQEAAQFGPDRYAYLFKPGKYDLDVQVGFYTHVAGLGRSPDDVHITGAVRSKARWMRNNNATCNFWRCVENLSVTPTVEGDINVWAVSQATALRRVRVRGNLHLWDGGWSSGGFMADCAIDGHVNSGSQQQWFARNSDWGEWRGGNWNMVFLGTTNPPTGTWPQRPYTTIDRTPVIREKPYLFVDENDRCFVMVPHLAREGRKGSTWSNSTSSIADSGTAIPIDRFHIARPDRDDATTINAALAEGKHLLLTPGIYHLDSPIRVMRPGTIVFGLGYPTLVPDNGTAAMLVSSDVDGVKLCGLLFDANTTQSPVLLQIGEAGSSASHAEDPIFLFDIFCRAGGAIAGRVDRMLEINANHVVGDNFWLWRADHGEGAKWDVNFNRNGLVVNGDDVTIYGLFVEHQHEYQSIWNGNGGRVYFYQSEMPYDPPSPEAWGHDGVRGYASYKVADHVMTHEAWGLGVYCVFKDSPIIADTAIEAPTHKPGVTLHHMITIRLSGQPGSGILHVINRAGDAVLTPEKKKAIVK
jgi:hypothetical protein